MSEFYNTIYKRHNNAKDNPNLEGVKALGDELLNLLFPERCSKTYMHQKEMELEFEELKLAFLHNVVKVRQFLDRPCEEIVNDFFVEIPSIYSQIQKDAQAITDNDPAARDKLEVIKTYPGFYAIAIYRLAHVLHYLNIPYIPRVLTEGVHSKTGIDIHPGAKIGESFCIDHGTGVVIGETCEIGDNVKVYQNVTLGALSVEKGMSNTKRHPTLSNNVIVYSGATILGGNTNIGENTIIGGNVWLTKSVPKNVKVYNRAEVIIKE